MSTVVLTEQDKTTNVKLDPYLEGILQKVESFMDLLVKNAHSKCQPNPPDELELCLYHEKNIIRSGILMQFLDKVVYLNEKIYAYPKEIRREFERRLREIVDGGLNKIYPSYIDPIP
jgi:hypothetical protein